MKKFLLILCSAGTLLANAQGPGLVISELLPNPSGSTDSPLEYVELVATRSIDFSLTPYSVVFVANSATPNGWVEGGSVTYGFDITSGTVAQGDVVYVGGDGMAPMGTRIRQVNTGTTNGDGFGDFNTSGVLGNGGSNADGVGVFNVAVASITSTTVPVDALFYGTTVGGAFAVTGGFTLPYNDLYAGGTVQPTTYIAPDPGGNDRIVATAGVFNPTTGGFTTARTFAIGSMSDGTSSITFSTTPGSVTFAIATAGNNQTVSEAAGTASFNVTVTNPNNAQAIIRIDASAMSNATATVDYTLSNNLFVVPAGSTTTQVVTVTIHEDALIESDEYVIFSVTPITNAATTGGNLHALYLRDNDHAAIHSTNELALNLLSSYNNGTEGSNSAEIVAHDPTTQRLYVANSIGGKLDILDFSNPAAITSVASINMSTYGGINSVAVHNGIVAAAVENGTNPQDSGKVVFFDANGTFLSSIKAGAMPDMITFNHAGNKVITVCEGEPNAAYTVDPEGRVVVVDISGGAATVTQADVTFINFTAYIGQETALRTMGVRIYGPGANAAQDFEPEYITISDDDNTGWVTLQENNALAIVDFTTNTITEIKPLGFKDHNVPGNGYDVTDQSAGINLSNFPIKGMYLPDAISHINIGGNNYLVTANEGDARAYSGFSEESRISALTLDAAAYPNAAQLKSNVVAGRLTVTNALGDTDADGDIDQIYSLGARSFSIWNGTTGALVYDSGDDFERFTSTHPTFTAMFNASNTAGGITAKNRSDDKGPETEGVTVAEFDGEYFAFASLERIGGVMIYNITDPANPTFVGYHNNRIFASNGPDRGAEGMIFIQSNESPNGNAILLLANEISSTLSVFEINTCRELSGVELMSSNGPSFCAGDSTNLYTNDTTGVTYEWIGSGETDTLLTVNAAGHYTLMFTNATAMCYDSTSIDITIDALPVVTANATDESVCAGSTTTLTGAGASTYTWTGGVTNGTAFAPTVDGTYVVTGTDANGCKNTDSIYIVVNALPVPVITFDGTQLSSGIYTSMLWSLGGTPITGANSNTWTPTVNGVYTYTVTDPNGCQGTGTYNLTTIGVTETLNMEGYKVYPNPFSTAVNITLPAGQTPTVSVMNAYGQKVFEKTGYAGESIDLSPLGNGMYMLLITNGNGMLSLPLVKN